MSGLIDIKIDNHRVVMERLRTFPDKVINRHLRAAYVAAAKVIKKEAELLVPVDQGALKSSLKIKVKWGRKKKYALVGADYDIAPHQHLVEFGTVERFRSKTQAGRGRGFLAKLARALFLRGGSTGRMPATPFMRPAFDYKKRTAARILIQRLVTGIRRESNK